MPTVLSRRGRGRVSIEAGLTPVPWRSALSLLLHRFHQNGSSDPDLLRDGCRVPKATRFLAPHGSWFRMNWSAATDSWALTDLAGMNH